MRYRTQPWQHRVFAQNVIPTRPILFLCPVRCRCKHRFTSPQNPLVLALSEVSKQRTSTPTAKKAKLRSMYRVFAAPVRGVTAIADTACWIASIANNTDNNPHNLIVPCDGCFSSFPPKQPHETNTPVSVQTIDPSRIAACLSTYRSAFHSAPILLYACFHRSRHVSPLHAYIRIFRRKHDTQGTRKAWVSTAASAHLRAGIVASRLDDLRRVVPLTKCDVELLHRVAAVLRRRAPRQGLLEGNLVPGSAEAHFGGAALRPFNLDVVKPEYRSGWCEYRSSF